MGQVSKHLDLRKDRLLQDDELFEVLMRLGAAEQPTRILVTGTQRQILQARGGCAPEGTPAIHWFGIPVVALDVI